MATSNGSNGEHGEPHEDDPPWNYEEITQTGINEYVDRDPETMLGKVAAGTARNTRALKALTGALQRRDDKQDAAISDLKEQMSTLARRTTNWTVAAIAASEVVTRILAHFHVIK